MSDASTSPGLEPSAEADARVEFFLEEGRNRDQWEEVFRAEMRPNRLVLLTGGLFHSHTCTFGRSLDDGRLVQLFFLDRAD